MYLKLIFLLVLAGCGDHVDSPSVTNQGGSFPIGKAAINRISDFSTPSTAPVAPPTDTKHDDHYEGPDLDRNYDEDTDTKEDKHHHHSDRPHDDDDEHNESEGKDR